MKTLKIFCFILISIFFIWNPAISQCCNYSAGSFAGYNADYTFYNTYVGFFTGYNNELGSYNTFLGSYAGLSNNTGKSTIIGAYAGYSSNASNSVLIGVETGYYSTGEYNTFVGNKSGYLSTSGVKNTFIGAEAGYQNNNGNYNSFLGLSAGHENTSGSYNTFLGMHSGYTNSIGTENNFIGYKSGYYNTSGTKNNFFGNYAGYNNTTANYNSFIGNYAGYKNTTGSYNNFFGRQAGYNNTSGTYNIFNGNNAGFSNTTGKYNNFIGSDAGFSNTTASYNTATGYRALRTNTIGEYNTAYGVDALYANTTGTNNTAIGVDAISENTTGYNNTAIGLNSMLHNTTGHDNTSNGKEALFNNTTGFNNTAIGSYSLIGNTTGSNNTALGDSAGSIYNVDYSTFIGYKAGVTNDNLINVTVIGNRALATASHQVRIGNNVVTSIGGKVSWSTLSDGRFKKNINEKVPGLSFINKLRPVTYTLDIAGIEKAIRVTAQSSPEEIKAQDQAAKENHTGFIAQEVEEAAKKLNYDFSGVDKPKNENDLYGLRYAEFVVPLVKAVQELSVLNEEKDTKINALQRQIDELKAMIIGDAKASITVSAASLEQNYPNPFNNNTVISYNIPMKFTIAQILISDNKGKVLSRHNISGSGKGTLTINTLNLSSGIYNYSLVIDGKMISTRKMTLVR